MDGKYDYIKNRNSILRFAIWNLVFKGRPLKGHDNKRSTWSHKNQINVRNSCIQLLLYFSCQKLISIYEILRPREIDLFSRPEWPSRCIFFHSFHSWKKYATWRPFWPFKKANFTFHRFWSIFTASIKY